MGSVQSDLKVSQVAVQSDLKSSSCSPVRLEIFKLMGLMGSMVNFANFTYIYNLISYYLMFIKIFFIILFFTLQLYNIYLIIIQHIYALKITGSIGHKSDC